MRHAPRERGADLRTCLFSHHLTWPNFAIPFVGRVAAGCGSSESLMKIFRVFENSRIRSQAPYKFDVVVAEMTLCDACSVLPIRDVLRESVGDEASTSRLQAWNEPGARYTDQFGAPFLKLNRNLGALQSSASECRICNLICVGLKGSLRFHDPTKWNAQSELWLRVSRGALYVWLGNGAVPLDNIGGCIGISATRGKSLLTYSCCSNGSKLI